VSSAPGGAMAATDMLEVNAYRKNSKDCEDIFWRSDF
jgi:hypothetical protein